MAVLFSLVLMAVCAILLRVVLRDPECAARVWFRQAGAWLVSPLGVVVASSLWLLLTHWGHSLPVVSWGSLLVLLGLSTLVRSLVLVAVRGWYFAASHGPAVARPAARHTSAAKAYLQKLRDGIEDQQNGEVL